jgi:streptomycin 6-kinase
VEVPDLVRQRAASLGPAGATWVRTLPDVLADLAARWHVQITGALQGGTAAFIATAVDARGNPRVVKVAMPSSYGDTDDEFDRAVTAHRLADGRGCVAMLAHDAGHRALLLERLGPNLHDLGLAVPDVMARVVDTMLAFWRPVPEHVALPTGADKAAWLREFIAVTWTALDRPCDRAVVDLAVRLCDERAAAFDPTTAVLVHGDAHGWNTVLADESTGACKFVDPEGLVAEREQDLAVPMRQYNEPLLQGDTARLVRERAEWLATRSDTDPDAVWAWGHVERVSTGLACLRDFESPDEGMAFLEVARRCAAADGPSRRT